MKFDFCIGNPPYQETKGGTKNIDIWPSFIKEANNIANNVCLIHPGRWVVPKKQMQETHNMIVNAGLKSFDYYPDASKLFSGVAIDGGVTITTFKNGYNAEIKCYNNGEDFGIYNKSEKFFSDEYEVEAYNKVFGYFNNPTPISNRMIGNVGSLAGHEFGYSKAKHVALLSQTSANMVDPIAVWANRGYGKGARFAWYFIEKDNLSGVPDKLFASRKVMLDKKGHSITAGTGNIINNVPQIVDELSTASGDVFFVFPECDNNYELRLIKSLFMTKTARFLMSITQKDLYVRGFENIPDYTLFMPMLNGALFTDEWFYKTFEFSNKLIAHIESHVSPKVETNNDVEGDE